MGLAGFETSRTTNPGAHLPTPAREHAHFEAWEAFATLSTPPFGVPVPAPRH